MTDGSAKSPLIEQVSWGQMKIAGLGDGKDFKLWPGGGREWDWTETGTRHEPGILPADVEELLERGCEIIILSRGMQLRLQTAAATLELLRQKNIELIVAETGEATRLYNDLAMRGKAVGGLFHSTC